MNASSCAALAPLLLANESSFASQGFVLVEGPALPLFMAALTGTAAAVVWLNGRLLAVLGRRLWTHPVPNLLLASASLGAVAASLTLFASGVYELRGYFHPCRLAVRNAACNWRIAPMIVAMAASAWSLQILGFQRALASRFRPASDWGERVGGMALVAAIWSLSLALQISRILRLGAKADLVLPFCTLQQSNLTELYASAFLTVLASFAALGWIVKVSKAQLKVFCSTQLHLSLKERASLRYNVQLSRAVAPVLLYSAVFSLIPALYHFTIRDALIRSIPVGRWHFVTTSGMLLFHFSPMLALGWHCGRVLRKIYVEEPRERLAREPGRDAEFRGAALHEHFRSLNLTWEEGFDRRVANSRPLPAIASSL